jgi:hypothetical protein
MTAPVALTLEPGAEVGLVEAPIFSKMESGKAIAPPPARAFIHSGHWNLE